MSLFLEGGVCLPIGWDPTAPDLSSIPPPPPAFSLARSWEGYFCMANCWLMCAIIWLMSASLCCSGWTCCCCSWAELPCALTACNCCIACTFPALSWESWLFSSCWNPGTADDCMYCCCNWSGWVCVPLPPPPPPPPPSEWVFCW